MRRNNTVAQRANYLRSKRKNYKMGWNKNPIILMDEIHPTYTGRMRW
jgi:hypothetical protein